MDFGLHVGSYRAQKKKKELNLVFLVELNWAWFFNGYWLIWFGTGLNDIKWACLGMGVAWILGLVSDLQANMMVEWRGCDVWPIC